MASPLCTAASSRRRFHRMRSPALPTTPAVGVMLSLIGTALFTPIFMAGKIGDLLLGLGAVPVIVIVAVRYVSGALTVWALVLLRPQRLSGLRSPAPQWHVLRALLGAGGGMCAIYAATTLPVVNATAIGLTEGLLIVGLAALLLGERVTVAHWAAGSLCAAGAAIVLSASLRGAGGPHPSFDWNASWSGSIVALVGAVLIALEALLIKVLSRREPPMAVLLYVNTFGALIMVGPGLWVALSSGMPFGHVLPFLLIAPLAITAQWCNVLAFRRADAAVLGPVSYAWIVFAALLSFGLFGEVPSTLAAVGTVIIVLGGVWLARLPA